MREKTELQRMEPLSQNALGRRAESVAVAGRDSDPDYVLNKRKNILTYFMPFVSLKYEQFGCDLAGFRVTFGQKI
jgi:hypothetical protein